MARARSQCTASELAAALHPLVQEHGKSFLRYDESVEVSTAKTDVASLKKYSYVACAIRHLGMVHKKTVARAAFDELVAHFGPGWAMTDEQRQDWSTTMTTRLRNFCTVINAAETKKVPPKWLAEVWGLAAETAAETTVLEVPDTCSASVLVEPPASVWEYEWHEQLQLASRWHPGRKAEAELSLPPDVGDLVNARDWVVAFWTDGGKWDAPVNVGSPTTKFIPSQSLTS